MNVFQFDVCSNCYVLVCWLFTYWEIYEMKYLGYLSVRRYNSVNVFLIAYPVVFQMPLFMPHGMCRVYAAVYAIYLTVGVMRRGGHEVAHVERGLLGRIQVPAVWSRACDVTQPLIGAVVATQCTVDL